MRQPGSGSVTPGARAGSRGGVAAAAFAVGACRARLGRQDLCGDARGGLPHHGVLRVGLRPSGGVERHRLPVRRASPRRARARRRRGPARRGGGGPGGSRCGSSVGGGSSTSARCGPSASAIRELVRRLRRVRAFGGRRIRRDRPVRLGLGGPGPEAGRAAVRGRTGGARWPDDRVRGRARPACGDRASTPSTPDWRRWCATGSPRRR